MALPFSRGGEQLRDAAVESELRADLRNLYEIVGRQLRLQGFLVRDYLHLQAEYEDFVVPHLLTGVVVADETITDGLANAPSAFLSMLAGHNLGKAIVRV